MRPRNSGSFETEPLRHADRLARRIRAAEAGDEKAVRSLLAIAAPTVARTVSLVLGQRHPDAEELVQESLVDFLRALPGPGEEPALEQLAAVVSLRRALEVWQWSPPAFDLFALEAEMSGPWYWRLFPGYAKGERRRRLVSRLLATLPDEEAKVLGLRLLAGLSVEQIAEFVGASAATVRSRLRIAKRELLDEMGAAHDAAIELHPEASRDQERAGALSPAGLARLRGHEVECPACALEREVVADLGRRWPPLAAWRMRVGRAIDSATSLWVWNASRRVTVPRRRHLAWVVWASLATLIAVGAGGVWLRYQAASDDLGERARPVRDR